MCRFTGKLVSWPLQPFFTSEFVVLDFLVHLINCFDNSNQDKRAISLERRVFSFLANTAAALFSDGKTNCYASFVQKICTQQTLDTHSYVYTYTHSSSHMHAHTYALPETSKAPGKKRGGTIPHTIAKDDYTIIYCQSSLLMEKSSN